MLKENLKHIILLVVAVILIGIGYLNYNEMDTIEVASTENQIDENTLGDAQLVNSETVKENLVPNDEMSNVTSTSSDSDEYFSKTRLERENMYSQMLETYQKIVDNDKITNEQKAIAIQEIDKITKRKNAIMVAENLIKNKNFEDVVILVSNDEASIVVKASSLSQEQISQIQNIVTRELDMKSDNINISKK